MTSSSLFSTFRNGRHDVADCNETGTCLMWDREFFLGDLDPDPLDVDREVSLSIEQLLTKAVLGEADIGRAAIVPIQE